MQNLQEQEIYMLMLVKYMTLTHLLQVSLEVFKLWIMLHWDSRKEHIISRISMQTPPEPGDQADGPHDVVQTSVPWCDVTREPPHFWDLLSKNPQSLSNQEKTQQTNPKSGTCYKHLRSPPHSCQGHEKVGSWMGSRAEGGPWGSMWPEAWSSGNSNGECYRVLVSTNVPRFATFL